MTDDMDLRLAKVEGTLDEVVILLEGEPVTDIDGTKIGTEGGMVRQNEQHTEALHIVDHKLDGILAQLPRRWTTTQRISASMVVVVALGSISTIVWVL